MTFFCKSSILFVTVNALRFLSVFAILLAFSGEVVLMVNDIKGYKDTNTTAISTSSSATASSTTLVRLVRRETISDEFGNTATITATSVSTSKASKKTAAATVTSAIPASTPTTAPTTSNALSQTTPSADTEEQTSSANCAYVGKTSVPKQIGGILFSTLDRIFCCIILIFAFFAEVPPPSKFTQRFWLYAFPPFGETFGVGVLGATQVFIGCSILSHAITNDFALVGAWFVFILGFLNMLFGLAFGASIKSTRSVFSTPTKPSGFRTLKLSQNQAPSSSFYSLDTDTGYEKQASVVSFAPTPSPSVSAMKGGRSTSRNGKNGIVISPPMMQNPDTLPVYMPGRS